MSVSRKFSTKLPLKNIEVQKFEGSIYKFQKILMPSTSINQPTHHLPSIIIHTLHAYMHNNHTKRIWSSQSLFGPGTRLQCQRINGPSPGVSSWRAVETRKVENSPVFPLLFIFVFSRSEGKVRCSEGMEAWLMVQGISPRPRWTRFSSNSSISSTVCLAEDRAVHTSLVSPKKN